MKGARYVIPAVSAVTGTCFAALAGLAVAALAVPVRRFQVLSIFIAVLALYLGFLGFRAALAGKPDEETAVRALQHGVIGALLGLVLAGVLLLSFGGLARVQVARAVGKSPGVLSEVRWLIWGVVAGFGAGFVARMPRATE